MVQRLAYPVNLERQKDGSVLVSFPDIPEALTEGATEEEALAEAEDCLIAALGGYIQARHAIPRPSPGRGASDCSASSPRCRQVSPLLRDACGRRRQHCARRTAGVTEGAVRRLIDPDHRSHIGQVEAALRALGQRLVVATQAA